MRPGLALGLGLGLGSVLQPLCSRDEFGVHRVSEVTRGVRAYEGAISSSPPCGVSPCGVSCSVWVMSSACKQDHPSTHAYVLLTYTYLLPRDRVRCESELTLTRTRTRCRTLTLTRTLSPTLTCCRAIGSAVLKIETSAMSAE